VVSKNALKKMKYEIDHENRLSTELMTDCLATKKIYDEICEGHIMKGMVQEIMFIPFGFLLFSEIQVKLNVTF
jgi:hypothetical protein